MARTIVECSSRLANHCPEIRARNRTGSVTTRFAEDDITTAITDTSRGYGTATAILSPADIQQLTRSVEKYTARQPLSKRLMQVLTDDLVPQIWQKAADATIEALDTQSAVNDDLWSDGPDSIPKFFLDKGLELCERVIYNKPLKDSLPAVYESIRAKVTAMDRFRAAYDKFAISTQKPLYPELMQLRRLDAPVFRVVEAQTKHASPMFGLYIVATPISFLPLVQAWRLSNNDVGSIGDVDFWLLIQTSTMQLLAIFLTIYPIYQRVAAAPATSSSGAWIWARVFTVLGICCTFAAVGLYLIVPTMWSAFVSSCGVAAQAGVALQLSLIPEVRAKVE